VVDTLGDAYLQQLKLQLSEKGTSTAYSAAPTTFFRVALETLGPMSVSTQEFLLQIGRRGDDGPL